MDWGSDGLGWVGCWIVWGGTGYTTQLEVPEKAAAAAAAESVKTKSR